MSANTPANAPAPAIHPVPGWLFFHETLPLEHARPAQNEAEVLKRRKDTEATVQLSLESHAPLPLEHLAYGWADDATRETLLYYATARERFRQTLPAEHENTLFFIPDFLLAPDTTPGIWHWLATPTTLTAIRFSEKRHASTPAPGAQASPKPTKAKISASIAIPAEIHSWPLDPTPPADPAEKSPDSAAKPPNTPAQIAILARPLRAQHEPTLPPGPHAPDTLIWQGATLDSAQKNILPLWHNREGRPVPAAAPLPVSAAWDADPRERTFLARERQKRASIRRANQILRAAAGAWVLLALFGTWFLITQGRAKSATALAAAHQIEANALADQNALLLSLDELKAGEISNPVNSFYDALATLNHLRPQSLLFNKATINAKREIRITGTAENSQQVTNFVERLRKDGSFSKVEEKTTTAAGGTTYTLDVTVKNLDVVRPNQGAPLSESEQEILDQILGTSSEKTDNAAEPESDSSSASPFLEI